MTSCATPDVASSPEDRAEDITFAVEIKCLIRKIIPKASRLKNLNAIRPFVPHQPVESRNSMTDTERQIERSAWEAVALILHTLPGVRAMARHRVKEYNLAYHDYCESHWLVYKANSAVPPYLSFVDGDPDRPLLDPTAPDYDKYLWIPLEICSPKLCWTQKYEALEAIGNVCQALRQRLGAVANHSCEVHVHVGRDDGLFFCIRSMKKLSTLLWLSEPVLRSVKDPKSPNFDHIFTWSFAWRQHSRLAMALYADGNMPGGQAVADLYTGKPDDFGEFLAKLDSARSTGCLPGAGFHFDDEHRQALSAIWGASDHEELGRMLCGPDQKHRRLGFNFHSLAAEDVRGRSSPRTVEFRFLEGHNEEDIVTGWVQICTGLAELALDRVEDGEFYRMVILLLSMPKGWTMDAKFVAIMHELGLPEATYEPLQRVIRRNYPPGSEKLGEVVEDH